MQVPLLFCRTIATFLTAQMFFTQCQMHLSYKLMWQPHSQILCDRSPYKGIPPIQQSHGLLVDFWHVQSGLWHCRIMSGLMRWSDQDDWRFLTNGTIGVESEFQSWDVEHHLRAFWELLWCQFKIVQCVVFFERFKAVSNFEVCFLGTTLMTTISWFSAQVLFWRTKSWRFNNHGGISKRIRYSGSLDWIWLKDILMSLLCCCFWILERSWEENIAGSAFKRIFWCIFWLGRLALIFEWGLRPSFHRRKLERGHLA